MVLERRAELVGEYAKRSKYAGFVVGHLYLAGAFQPSVENDADEKAVKRAIERSDRRRDILIEFAKIHFWLWGSGTAPSHLRNAVAGGGGISSPGDDRAEIEAKWRKWCTLAMLVPPGRSRVLAHQVLERAALYEIAPANAAELDCLIRVADRLIAFDKEERRRNRKSRGDREDFPKSTQVTRTARRDRMLDIYSRGVFGPSDEELAEALARFRVLPTLGSAD
jgi:hypothetical protein